MSDSAWLLGLAQYLDDSGVGVWLTTGSYSVNQRGIVVGELPPSPPQAIGLIPYALGDEHGERGGDRAIQITLRAPTMVACLDLQQEVFDALDQKTLRLGGVNVPLIWRQIPGVMAPDESKREIVQDSYYLRIVRA